VSTRRLAPPWDFFHDASIASLESYELSRLNHAANLRRQITVLLDQWVEENSQALLARWVREGRALLRPEHPISGEAGPVWQAEFPFDQSATPGLLPRPRERLPRIARRQIR
jgi:hypothetical protein